MLWGGFRYYVGTTDSGRGTRGLIAASFVEQIDLAVPARCRPEVMRYIREAGAGPAPLGTGGGVRTSRARFSPPPALRNCSRASTEPSVSFKICKGLGRIRQGPGYGGYVCVWTLTFRCAMRGVVYMEREKGGGGHPLGGHPSKAKGRINLRAKLSEEFGGASRGVRFAGLTCQQAYSPSRVRVRVRVTIGISETR